MPAAIPGPNWRYESGDYVAGRKILAQKQAKSPADRNVYEVQYDCCLKVGEMTQQSLRRLERDDSGKVKPCNTCCALKASKASRSVPEAKEKASSDLTRRYPGEKPLVTAWTRWASPRKEEMGRHFVAKR